MGFFCGLPVFVQVRKRKKIPFATEGQSASASIRQSCSHFCVCLGSQAIGRLVRGTERASGGG